MTKLYFVERHGVYSQGIFGIYSTREKAREACLRAKALEPDNYHNFCFTELELDVDSTVKKVSKYWSPEYLQDNLITQVC